VTGRRGTTRRWLRGKANSMPRIRLRAHREVPRGRQEPTRCGGSSCADARANAAGGGPLRHERAGENRQRVGQQAAEHGPRARRIGPRLSSTSAGPRQRTRAKNGSTPSTRSSSRVLTPQAVTPPSDGQWRIFRAVKPPASRPVPLHTTVTVCSASAPPGMYSWIRQPPYRRCRRSRADGGMPCIAARRGSCGRHAARGDTPVAAAPSRRLLGWRRRGLELGAAPAAVAGFHRPTPADARPSLAGSRGRGGRWSARSGRGRHDSPEDRSVRRGGRPRSRGRPDGGRPAGDGG